MKKRVLPILLALAVVLAPVPPSAFAAEAELPDWYFLFAIFKNVDADYNQDGEKKHTTYTMTQDEIDFVKEDARDFAEFMDRVGVMRAHVDVVEIDAAVTELQDYGSSGGYLSERQAEPLLKDEVDLDRYDHVTCVVSLNADMGYLGLGGTSYESGTGHTCINLKNREYCINTLRITEREFPSSMYVHELLHFMENMNRKWGAEFGLHDIRIDFYDPVYDNGRACYTDIILNRARGTAGTGVHPIAWQYPPRVLRAMTELAVPAGVTGVGDYAFRGCATLRRITIPSTVAGIGKYAFHNCSGLTEVTISPGVTDIEYSAFQDCAALRRITIPPTVCSIGTSAFQDCASLTEATFSPGVSSIGIWAFGNCTALTRVFIPASVTSIDYAAFWNTGIKDVYYGGTEEEWNAIRFGEFNGALTGANIHYVTGGTLGADLELTWTYDPGTGQVTVTGTLLSADEPVYAAVYQENGKMTGAFRITSSGESAAVGDVFGRVKLIWTDKNAAPKCACVEIPA